VTKVSSRNFFRNPYTYLDNLPVVVTKGGIPKYVVTKYDILTPDKIIKPKQTLEQSEKIVEEFIEKKREKGGIKLCKHGAMIGLCKHNCKK